MLVIDLIDQDHIGDHSWPRFLNAKRANFDRVFRRSLHQQRFVNWWRVFHIEKVIVVNETFVSMYKAVQFANSLFFVIVTLYVTGLKQTTICVLERHSFGSVICMSFA